MEVTTCHIIYYQTLLDEKDIMTYSKISNIIPNTHEEPKKTNLFTLDHHVFASRTALTPKPLFKLNLLYNSWVFFGYCRDAFHQIGTNMTY
ncbi:hypothetical protein EYC80_002050 [Monilinia laxa]|uniref:Uncharacterized protein n=1 Tax=Monilinia laxa TaxID=61186 RepID=A0A5N6K719_MONLA|nr:hypothetical protein EYC80_002050 [Monilinia laxa]